MKLSNKYVIVLAFLLLVAGCGDDAATDATVGSSATGATVAPAETTPEAGRWVTAAEGDTITTDDGGFSIEIAPGSLSEDTRIVIRQRDDAEIPIEFTEAGLILPVFSMEPDGLTFLHPVEVSMRLDPAALAVTATNDDTPVLIVYSSDGTAELVADQVVTTADDGTIIITGHISHFSNMAAVPAANAYLINISMGQGAGYDPEMLALFGTTTSTSTTTAPTTTTTSTSTTTAPTTTTTSTSTTTAPTTTTTSTSTTTAPTTTTTTTSTTTAPTTTTMPSPVAILDYRELCYSGGGDPSLDVLFTSEAASGASGTLVLVGSATGTVQGTTVSSSGYLSFGFTIVGNGETVTVVSLTVGGVEYTTNWGTFVTPTAEQAGC